MSIARPALWIVDPSLVTPEDEPRFRDAALAVGEALRTVLAQTFQVLPGGSSDNGLAP